MISLKRISSLSSGLKSRLPILGEVFVVQKKNASSYGHMTKYGQGGRNSFNGNVVTVFGATGFMGRYVISRLAKVGTQIVVPYRGSEDDVRPIRVMGDLGQIVFLNFSINDYDSILKTMTHSNCVVNLIGRNFSNRNFTMQDIMVGGAGSIAKAAAECGVENLVHISHLLANEDSPSEFMRAKAEGEKVVTSAFPGATIMRPAQAYGDEDLYLNKIAYLRKIGGFVPLVEGGKHTLKRPVFICDVAQAVVNATLDQTHKGKTFELYGPEEYYLRDMVDFVLKIIRKDSWTVVDVPLKLFKLVGKVADLMTPFEPRITEDMVQTEHLSEPVSDDAFTFADLGIEPVHLNDTALSVLRRHRHYYYWDEIAEDDVCTPSSVYR